MTEAADTRGLVPTALSSSPGAQRGYPYRSQIATSAAAMMSKRNSQLARSPFIQTLIDIGAILFAAFFICLFAVAIAVAVFAFLFVKF